MTQKKKKTPGRLAHFAKGPSSRLKRPGHVLSPRVQNEFENGTSRFRNLQHARFFWAADPVTGFEPRISRDLDQEIMSSPSLSLHVISVLSLAMSSRPNFVSELLNRPLPALTPPRLTDKSNPPYSVDIQNKIADLKCHPLLESAVSRTFDIGLG